MRVVNPYLDQSEIDEIWNLAPVGTPVKIRP
jgi:hypothetical protein